MVASYSKDFRQKVMTYVEQGNNCRKASIKFEIAANTVRNWYKRYKQEGHYLAKKVGGKKARFTTQEIADYVEANPNCTLLEMGNHFNMTSVGAYYWLKKLGYSYKKKPLDMWKRAKRGEMSIKKS